MVPEQLLRVARSQEHCALATSDLSGVPQVAVVQYLVTDAFELITGTLSTSRKASNLLRNPEVAMTIWSDQKPAWTLQLQGVVDRPEGEELEVFKQLFASTYPEEFRMREQRPTHFFYRIRPTWVRFTDFTREGKYALDKRRINSYINGQSVGGSHDRPDQQDIPRRRCSSRAP